MFAKYAELKWFTLQRAKCLKVEDMTTQKCISKRCDNLCGVRRPEGGLKRLRGRTGARTKTNQMCVGREYTKIRNVWDRPRCVDKRYRKTCEVWVWQRQWWLRLNRTKCRRVENMPKVKLWRCEADSRSPRSDWKVANSPSPCSGSNRTKVMFWSQKTN